MVICSDPLIVGVTSIRYYALVITYMIIPKYNKLTKARKNGNERMNDTWKNRDVGESAVGLVV